MKDWKITICGAGTLGGNLAENLARMGLGALTVIDMDRVERRNCANQPYGAHDVGQPKVKALSEYLFRAAGARLTAVNRELSPGNADRLLEGADLVVDMFDNAASRQAVSDACARSGVPCLHAGLSHGGYGEVVWSRSYTVPSDESQDVCEEPLARTLAILVVAVATTSIAAYFEERLERSYTVTAKDLAIERLECAVI